MGRDLETFSPLPGAVVHSSDLDDRRPDQKWLR